MPCTQGRTLTFGYAYAKPCGKLLSVEVLSKRQNCSQAEPRFSVPNSFATVYRWTCHLPLQLRAVSPVTLVSYYALAMPLVPSISASSAAVKSSMPPPCFTETHKWVASLFPPQQRYFASTVAVSPSTWQGTQASRRG